MKIGFIGTGVMGTGVINNLLKHKRGITVFNRTKAHAKSVLANGAVQADSPAEIAENFSLGSYGPRILKNDYTPGFFAKHFLKDLKIVLEEAEEMKLNLPAINLAKRLYQELVDNRKQALIKLWWIKLGYCIL